MPTQTYPPTLLLATSLLLLAPAAGAVDVSAPIINVAPTILSVSLGGLTGGALTPVPGDVATLTATVTVSDLNGFNDISSVTVGILKPDGSTVHVAQGAASFVSGTLLEATYSKTLGMNYHDAAATGASSYKVKAIATDAGALAGNNLASLSTFNYNTLVALQVPATLDLGGSGIAPGSAGAITSLVIQNYGNQQIDAQISGGALSYSGNTIPVGSVAYSLSSDLSSPATLSGTAATLTAFDLGAGAGSSKNAYFRLTAPTGLPPGTYTGTLAVTAVAG